MEDNDKLFWEGLSDILEEPWKTPPVIQDTIPPLALTIEDGNTDGDKQDTFGFYFLRLELPFYFVVAYFVQNNKHFFSYFTDGDGLDVFSPIHKASRLTTHDIYEVFSWLSTDCALVLLEHIDCQFSVYTELKESLEANEKERFIEIIDNLDLENIIPTLSFVRFLINEIGFIRDKAISKDNNTGEDDLDSEDKKSRILYNCDRILTDELGHPAKGSEKQAMLSMAKHSLNLRVLPEAFFNYLYSSLFYGYCWADEDGFLTESDKKVFDYIFRQPAFEEQYNQNMVWWENEIIEEKVEEFALKIKENSRSEVVEGGEGNPIEANPVNYIFSTSRWHLPDDFFTESYIDTCDVKEYFPMFMEHIIKLGRVEKEKLPDVKKHFKDYFESFINWLARTGYIDNTSIIKSSFAHALTGRKVDGETVTVTWKRADKKSSIQNNWTNNISYMIRELYPHTICDKNGNVIGRYAHLKIVFSFEEGNEKSSVGSSYPKYADDDFKNKVDEFVKDVDLLARAFGISPKQGLL